MQTFTQAFAAIKTAYDRANGAWKGLDWTTDGSESYTAEQVRCDAFHAESAGELAIAAVNNGDLVGARDYAANACDLERNYGDCPTWGPLRAAIQAAIEALHDEEIDPDLAVTPEEIAGLRAAAVASGNDRMVEIIDSGGTPEVVAEAIWQAQVEAQSETRQSVAPDLEAKDLSVLHDNGHRWTPSAEVRARLQGHYRAQTMAVLYCLRAPHRGTWDC